MKTCGSSIDFVRLNSLDVSKGLECADINDGRQEFFSICDRVNEFAQFFLLLELCMNKSYSEAICETVGSIMRIHGGKGRHLHPVNFSKEVCLNFNLPPVHTLTSIISGLTNQIVNVEKKRFSRRGRSGLWKYSKYSASVGNYRNRVEDESHTPVGTLCV